MGEISETEAMGDITVYQVDTGEGDGADMAFTYNGRLICVSIFPSNGSSAEDSRHLDPEQRPLQGPLTDLLA
jgi:hypothetical protein